jgi:hypothetical protein
MDSISPILNWVSAPPQGTTSPSPNLVPLVKELHNNSADSPRIAGCETLNGQGLSAASRATLRRTREEIVDLEASRFSYRGEYLIGRHLVVVDDEAVEIELEVPAIIEKGERVCGFVNMCGSKHGFDRIEGSIQTDNHDRKMFIGQILLFRETTCGERQSFKTLPISMILRSH